MGIRSYIQQALESTVYYGSNVNRLFLNPARGDEFFNYTSLLLDGDGTNATQNNTFLDSSSNNFTITRNGNTTQGSFSPFGDKWSNYFDGTNSFHTLPINSATQFGTGEFTIEAWIYRSGATGGNTTNANIIGTNWSGSSQTGQWIFYLDSNYKINLALWNTSTGSSTSTINIGQWYHVAVSRSGTTTRLFVNGVLESTVTDSGNYGSTTWAPRIGNYNDPSGFNGYFNGYISNLRVIKGTALYTSNFTPPTEPLTAVSGTSLLTCQSNRFLDASTNNFTITRNGDVRVQSFNPFGLSNSYSPASDGGSGYFAANGDYLTLENSTPLNLSGGTYTIEGWINPTGNYANYNTIIAKRVLNSSTTAWEVYLRISTGVLSFYNGTNYESTTVPVANSWNYFAAVYDGTNINLYLNGTRVLQSAIANNDVSASIQIGTFSSYTEQFLGYISDLRITKGAALYSGTTMTVPTTSLTTTTSSGTVSLLCNFKNASIYDKTKNNVLETVGNAQVSTTQKKYGTGALYFDGTGDYLSTRSGPHLTFGGDFTIEAWVYITSLVTYHPILEGRSANTYSNYVFGINNISGTLRLDFVNAGGATNRTATTTSVPLNTWTHVAWVRSGGITSYYVNGVKDATTNSYSASLAPASSNVLIGAVVDPYYFNGYIDELRVTNGIARYTTSFTPPTREFPAIFGPNTENNPILASGGNNIIDDTTNGYRTHIFTSPGSFVVYNNPATVDYLVVAGAGGGAQGPLAGGGGGGAGGFRSGTGLSIPLGTYPITVGGGGAINNSGSNSVFNTITSNGGGAGGQFGPPSAGVNGGSGGGGGANSTGPAPVAGGSGNTPPTSPPQGNPGGAGNHAPGVYASFGGGGGAGGAGSPNSNTPNYPGGPGGIGSPITWIPASYGTPGPAPGRYFAGGGGGGGFPPVGGVGGSGGSGGGGTGGGPGAGVNGTTNTGGGGGGGAHPSPGVAGSGGSGIIAVRYPKTFDNIVRDGLVLNLDAGDVSSYPGSGTTWFDLTGNGNNGTLTNGPTYSSSNGGSLVFDGSDDVVNGTINGSIFTGNFTQSAWIYKLNANQIWQGVFTNSSPATNNTYLMTFGNGSVAAPYNSVGANQVGVSESGIFLDIGTHINKWLNITITKSGSTLTIYCYKDGSLLQNSGTITWNGGNFATTNNYQIGRHWANAGVVPLQGNISNITLYNKALTASEIEQNYNALKGRYGL
jgi:hypothetical protein